jgi:hypothetical protein
MAYNLHSITVTKPGSSLGKNWKGLYTRTGKRKRTREFGLYSWNVRTIYQVGSLRKLVHEMGRDEYTNGVDVLAIQEVRWTGNATTDKENHVLSYSGHQKKHEFGVGFL